MQIREYRSTFMDASNIIDVLDTQNNIYQLLIDLSQRMNHAITSNDIKEIDALIQLEVALIMKLSVQEKKREKLVALLTKDIPCKGNSFNISDLKDHMLEKQYDSLLTIEKGLTANIEKLAHLNQANNLLINNRLDWINFSLRVLGVTEEHPYGMKRRNDKSKLVDEIV